MLKIAEFCALHLAPHTPGKLCHLPMETEYCGGVIRYLIENHRKGRPTPKAELRSTFDLHSNQINGLLQKTQEYLLQFGLEIVGLSSGRNICPIPDSDKLFMRKIFRESVKRAKITVSLEEKRLYTVFSLIQLEDNNMEEARLSQIQKCKYFHSVGISEFFKKYKMLGYVDCRRTEDACFWSLGWRFYVEFGDSFDIVDHFEHEAPMTR